MIRWYCALSNKEDTSYASIQPRSPLRNQFWPISAAPVSSEEVRRPIVNFHPDVWGNYFLNYTPEDKTTRAYKEEQVEELKKQIRKELMIVPGASYDHHLKLIDDIERLGVGYHFEKEIEAVLRLVNENCEDGQNQNDSEDLYTVSLRFRVFRQHGLDSSSDVFNKFTDKNEKFKESLTGDWKGMLSLYEAANFGKLEGDEILEKALAFTTIHLSSVATSHKHSNDPLVPQIIHALKIPILKNIPRLETRRYIPIYEKDISHNNKDILMLAKLDFNLLQSMHRQELSELVRWWKGLDVERKFPYARSRIVEVYFCIYATMFQPKYQLSRKILTKVLSLTSIIDDTYDNYGTFEELQLLTTAVHRWSANCVDQLPETMRDFYQLLLNSYQEIEEELGGQDTSHLMHYAKTAMKKQMQGYFDEAKWLAKGYIPTMEEYMRVASVTTGFALLSATFLVSMVDVAATEVKTEAFHWLESNPRVLTAGEIVARLMDDIATIHKFEEGMAHIPSAVEVYMKEHNVSEKEAQEALQVEINKAWKILSEECIVHKHMPVLSLQLYQLVLNLSRLMAITYMDGQDGQTTVGPRTKENIMVSFIDPVPMQ